MKKLAYVFIFLVVGSITLYAQDPLYKQWNADVVAKANTAKNVSYLTDQEKRVIYLCNLARLDGKLFSETYLKDYNSNKSNSYVKSLYSDLAEIKNLPVLLPSENLTKAARYHAIDMGDNGKTGHNSSDGTRFATRVRSYSKGGYIAENCSYGYNDALNIVMQLLIDDGVPSLGHRINILSTNYTAVGVAIEPHTGYSYNCVMDFSDTVE